MVALSALLAFTAVANGAAHLQPHDVANAQPQLAGRELAQRDVWDDISAWWNQLIGSVAPRPASSTIVSSRTAVSSSVASSKPAVSSGVSGTAWASCTKPSATSAVGTASVGSSVQPASSSAPSSRSIASGTAVPSASGSLSTVIRNPSGSSVSACPKPPSRSNGGTAVSPSGPVSGTGATGSGAQPSRSASGTAVSGTAVKSSTKASGTVSSKASSSSVTPSEAASNSATPSEAVSSTPISLTGPSASAPAGTFVGASWNGVDQFLNIPFAEPPVGPLRLKPPVPLSSSLGVYNATGAPNSCPQFATGLTGNYSAGGLQPIIDQFVFAPTPSSEDCLTINVFRPNTTTPDAKLPVVYWIFGGGWQFGSTSMFNGTDTVRKSVQLGAPVIFVEVNYRLAAFGFLAGADLAAEHSTNLGLRDQRLGLEWVSDNIESFGGDPSKVTLWGESAGSISSAYQLAVRRGNNTYKGKPLFRGSIHNSGAFAPADNATAPQAQEIYDIIVSKTGCSAPTAAERLACLRSVDYEILQNASISVPGFGGYRSADLSYVPRVDEGDNFYDFPTEYAVAASLWTKTPFIIGNQEDEGTLLAIVQNNITTNDELVDYVASWFPNNPNAVADVRGLAALYPDDVAGGQPAGSPYRTGSDNNLYPQYKRLAAILGDIVFIITRRAFLQFGTGQGIPAWSYISTYLQGLANFGTLHGSDLAYLFDAGFAGSFPTNAIQTHYISFINYLDPNQISSPQTTFFWPTWNSTTPELALFGGGETTLGNDTFRSDVYDYLLTKVNGFKI